MTTTMEPRRAATGTPAPAAGAQRTWRIAPTKAEIDPIGHARRLRTQKILLGVSLPVVLIVLWQIAAQLQWIDRRFFPGPIEIAQAAVDMVASGQWFGDVLATLRTILIATAAGFVVGSLLGIVMGSLSKLRYVAEPTLSAFYTIPKIALLPLMLLIFGIGDMPGYLLVALGVFFIAWISALEAVLAVPVGYREAAEAFGVSRLRRFGHVTIPAVLPAIIVALRISIGQAVLIVIMVEYLMGKEGIGYRIWHAWSLFDADTMYVGIVTVALLGYVLQLLVKVVGAKLVPWSGGTSAAEK